MKITKSKLKQIIKEAAGEYVWGVKGSQRVANQYDGRYGMKITKSQLKQIIKEELGRSLEEDEGAEGGLYDIYPKSPQTDYRTEFESIDADLEKIQMMTTPDRMKTGERVDVVLDQAAIEEIHNMATDSLDTISQYITQMMRED